MELRNLGFVGDIKNPADEFMVDVGELWAMDHGERTPLPAFRIVHGPVSPEAKAYQPTDIQTKRNVHNGSVRSMNNALRRYPSDSGSKATIEDVLNFVRRGSPTQRPIELSRIGNSVDRLTGVSRQSSVSQPAQYINDAFSFLDAEEHGAYKYYDHNHDLSENYIQRNSSNGPSSRHYYSSSDYDRSQPSHQTSHHRHSNGHADYVRNGQAGSGVFPYNHNSPGEKNPESQLKYLKIALALTAALLILVIVIGLSVYFTQLTKANTVSQYYLEVKLNETWDPALGNSDSAEYKALKSDFEEAVKNVFAEGPFTKIYAETQKFSLKSTSDGKIMVSSVLKFEDKNGIYKVGIPSSQIRAELEEELPNIINRPIASITINEYDSTLSTTTIAPMYTDPTNKAGTGFTTVPPTAPPTPSEETCIDLEESRCTGYDYTVQTVNSERSAEQFTFLSAVKDQNCYNNAERFACEAAYPRCMNKKVTKPCRMYCEEYASACNVPVVCDTYANDDIESACALQPGYTVPDLPDPPSDPCSADTEFRCGTDPPTCIPVAGKCNGTSECDDLSDEASERAGCNNDSMLTCDFENGDLCTYEHDNGYNFKWTLQNAPAPSAGTGAKYDHTTLSRTGGFLLAEASGQFHGAVARVRSPLVVTTSKKCFHFYFHMHGNHMGTLKVTITYSQGTKILAWIRSGNQGDTWKKGEFTLLPGASRVNIAAIRGDGYQSDIAIDDISIKDGECTSSGCESGSEFACTNKNCQPLDVVCNGRNECGDFSDELNCNCTEKQYKCNMGMCIPNYQRCDGMNQCPDNSDEEKCSSGATAASSQSCSHGRHRCSDNKCIMPEWICDGEDDCSSDEINCESCENDEFQCQDNQCIPMTQVCDGINQCSGGADEHNCAMIDNANVVQIGPSSARLPLCEEGLPQDVDKWYNEICRLANMGEFENKGTIVETTTMYMKVKSGEGDDDSKSFLSILETSQSCQGGNVVTVNCAMKTCGMPGPASQIIGGTNSASNKWPWQVGIFYKMNGPDSALICGGTIISEQHVMTAAHCADGNRADPEKFEILAGASDIQSQGGTKVGVAEIKIYPSYKIFYLGDDIALFVLARKLTFSSSIQPICLPSTEDTYGPGSICYATGWGKTTANGRTSQTLQQAKLKIWPSTRCMERHAHYKSGMLCAGYESGYIANCQGDSGGPLVCKGPDNRWILKGVYSSSAQPCTRPQSPPIFTQVQTYSTWINSNTECTFDCGGGECLYTDSNLCDDFADCSNYKDELSPACPSSISCNFAMSYKCGYINIKGNWHRARGSESALVNTGPMADSTLGNFNGWYLYSKLSSVIVAPLFNEANDHCLSFHYNLRGEAAGILKVMVRQVDANFQPWTLDLNTVVDVDFVFTREDQQESGWLRGRVDVAAGSRLIGFFAQAKGDSGPAIGIDDIILTTGTCSSLDQNNQNNGCEQNERVCSGSSGNRKHWTCFPDSLNCNNIVDCIDTQTDESIGCSSSRLDYMCNMENINYCGIVQNTDDDYDWRLIQAGLLTTNYHPWDATTSNMDGGHYLYMDTRFDVGRKAYFTLGLGSARDGIACLSFKYIIHRNRSSMTVSGNRNDIERIIWKGYDKTSTDWNSAQVEVPPEYLELIFTGSIIEDSTETEGFVAIDDISFKEGRCENPECLNEDFRCNDGTCIKGILFCDGICQCPGNDLEDEPPDCECFSDYFNCANGGGCLTATEICNTNDDCPDRSDELQCDCAPNDYMCPTGRCITITQTCNKVNDCENFEDEYCDCAATNEFTCSNGMCIIETLVCNGWDDCGDMSDEEDCVHKEKGCPSWQMPCADNSTCIAKDLKCDGWNDCTDSSDEADCSCDSTNEFFCKDTNLCLTPGQRCNNMNDCPSEIDETGCGSGVIECLKPPDGGVCDCGTRPSSSSNTMSPSSQLVGGAPVQDAGSNSLSWPWSCALIVFGEYLCGCVLLSDRWVLTAAHCFERRYERDGQMVPKDEVRKSLIARPKYIKVVLGSINRTSPGIVAEKLIIHSDHTGGEINPNDIALVQLSSTGTVPLAAKPICLPAANQTFTPNSHCYTIGWGWTRKVRDGTFKYPPVILREARMRVRDESKCQSEWPNYPTGENKLLCTGHSTAVVYTCGGDSGSPLMCLDEETDKWQLAGLVSAGYDCSDLPIENKFSIFTNAAAFRTWIDTQVDMVGKR